MRFGNGTRKPERLTKAAIALARGGESEIVHRLYCPTRKPNRQNIYEIRTRTIGFIIKGLRETLGIAVGDGISFHEVHSDSAAA
jgi:hypothetical protein